MSLWQRVMAHFTRQSYYLGSLLVLGSSQGTRYKTFAMVDGKIRNLIQAKELRMEWLKRRRERLAVKLAETQREIESMKAH